MNTELCLALLFAVAACGCAQDCDELRSDFAVRAEVARQARAACQTEADCTTITAGDCKALCAVAVAKTQSAALQAEIQALNDELGCGTSGCGVEVASCAQAKLACTAGRCEATFF